MLSISIPPEPIYFNKEIREKGNQWIKNHNYSLNKSKKLPPYWVKCLEDLHCRYNGICAYYCFYIELGSGAETVDHFKPKSKYPELTYEWVNYRLSSSRANSYKRNYEDIWDPANFPGNVHIFELDFATGEIYPNPLLSTTELQRANDSIKRLQLCQKRLCKTRMMHYLSFLKGETTERSLKKRSPFVWSEAKRQELI